MSYNALKEKRIMSDTTSQHRHTNQLIHETSPYLLQHAHNPVDWYAWGEEALRKARELDRPILLSVGYSACHWCHVMERESFENEEIAQIMNEHFVSIKVDREERPDIDAIYMQAVQALTGQGGWPMTMFLLPDGRPFEGGTYFPPRDRQYGNQASFRVHTADRAVENRSRLQKGVHRAAETWSSASHPARSAPAPPAYKSRQYRAAPRDQP